MLWIGQAREPVGQLVRAPTRAPARPPRPRSASDRRASGSGAAASMVAIERKSRSISACAAKRPAASAASSVPYLRSRSAAPLRTDARSARQLVGGVAAQGDEIRHLLGIDAVALADLGRTDARHLARPHRDRGSSWLRRRAETCRGRRSPPARCRRAAPRRRPRRRGNHRPRSPAALALAKPQAATNSGSASSCSSSASSNSRPLW